MVIAAKSIESNFKSAKNWLLVEYLPKLKGFNNYYSFKKEFSTDACPRGDPLHENELPGVKGKFVYDHNVTWEGGLDSRNCDKFNSSKDAIVVFINGDLTIAKDLKKDTLDHPIVFIVQGNIKIVSSIEEINAVFIADGDFITLPEEGVDIQLKINGSVAAALNGKGQLTFGRDLGSDNDTKPAEKITFDPKYLYLLSGFIDNQASSTEEVSP